MNERVHKIFDTLNEIKSNVSNKDKHRLKLEKMERLLKRVHSFSSDCPECEKYLNELGTCLHEMHAMNKLQDKEMLKQHSKKVHLITAHLQKKHKLVTEGYYMSVFMSVGVAIGVALGLSAFDNIGMGIPIGIGIGIAIGAGMDADAKKKGLVL